MSELARYLGDLHGLLPDYATSAVIVVSSMFCGTIIGREREALHKPAGMKTMALICLGCTLFTIASALIGTAGTDRSRIASQIVTGIGFLGAGAIIRERGQVHGLTTAATIWVVAAIGVLIGAGYVAGGVAVTVIVRVLLTVLRRLERHHMNSNGH